jgi:hypothetical protein
MRTYQLECPHMRFEALTMRENEHKQLQKKTTYITLHMPRDPVLHVKNLRTQQV